MVNLILWFFSGVGFLGSWIARLGKAFFVSGAILTLQFAVVGALVAVRIAYLTTIITLILWVYNKLVEIFELLNLTYSDSVLYIPMSILKSIGFFEALLIAFSSFNYIIVSLLVLFVSKFVLNSIQSIADEYFKIAVLINLGVK